MDGMVHDPMPLPPDHPKGELQGQTPPGQKDTFSVKTAGGMFHVRWDHQARVSANGGVVHFAQFLESAKVFDEWVAECPLSYESNRAHDVRDILGTMMLSALNGHRRYAHITALRGDSVNPQVLHMKQMVSEDTVRRALRRMDGEAARYWQERHLIQTLEPLLSVPWILDVDVTVKPLYGYQEGAVVGHNPHKPGRPSHALHTFLLAKARLVLDVHVHPGDQHTSTTTKVDLFNWLEKIPQRLWPKLLRGDCGFGNEDMMAWPEAAGISYLFKQRMTVKTKALVRELDLVDGWVDAGQGWQAKESVLRLSTWTKTRRAIILRRPSKPRYLRRKDLISEKEPKQKCIEEFQHLISDDTFDYQVLVTSLTDSISAVAQCYRDRADAENVFDELKNEWGWGGFTSRKLEPCQIAARIIAQVYNWWSIFVRLASPDHHREMVTARPLLLHSIVRQTTTSGQRVLTISSTHAKAEKVANFFHRLASFLNGLHATAEHWTRQQSWEALLRKIFASAFSELKPGTS